jgi:hypothetical protein
MLILQGVTRVDNRKKGKEDIAGKAEEMQDRLERTLGCKSTGMGQGTNIQVEEEDAPEEGSATEVGERYTILRHTDFYGLGCEEWLNLIVKASIESVREVLLIR